MLRQEQGTSLDLALTHALKTVPDLDALGRRRAVQALHDINRSRARLSWHLARQSVRVTPHHLFLVWTALRKHGEPKAIRISDLDRALLQRFAGATLDDLAMPEATRLECPPAFEGALRAALGADFAKEMTASLEPPPVDLRVNTLKSTVRDVRAKLKAESVDARPAPLSPWGLRCAAGTNVSATAAFRDGLVEFQDEGSQLAVLLCDANPGMQVLDFCAGTGGKTLALGAVMENRGHLVACDISTVRMARAKVRLKRAGVENAERRQLLPTDDKWMKKHHGRFDRVLVDAPCSGTGSWRRNPDARWSTQAANLDELTALQDAILRRAANFVKPGGHLIYATCSLLRRENDERVAQFLRDDPAFVPLDASKIWNEATDKPWPCGTDTVLRLSPARHGTDGFFAAVLQRSP
jgi:16S rRNA (cytosine967-C5)-methyltransferase